MMSSAKRRSKQPRYVFECLAGATVLFFLFYSSRNKLNRGRSSSAQSGGLPCSFTKWVNPSVEPPEEELGGGWACPSERFCQMALRHSCLQRRPKGADSRTYEHDLQLLVAKVSQPEQCEAMAGGFSDLYKGCRRFGLNANMRYELGDGSAGSGGWITKPTILVNCVDMMCDNWFHAIVYVAYPTAALMDQLGLKDLRGYSLRILSDKRKGRELLVGLMETFNPDEVIYSELAMGEEQELGCYKQVYFMGYDSHPFHCDLGRKVGINPTLMRMSRLITSNMGFPKPPPLPQEISVLHAKRTGRRRILNPEEVEAEFRRPIRYADVKDGDDWKEGFKKTIELHRGVSVLFGIHGAGLTNLLFLPPGSVVIEVGNDGFVFHAFRNMAVQSGHYYMSIEVSKAANDSAVVLPDDGNPQGADVWVQPREVRRVMDTAEQLLQLRKSS